MGEISRFGKLFVPAIQLPTQRDADHAITRETIKRLLAFPPDTNIVWKSHDDSIAQRSALDQARQDKSGGVAQHHGPTKRRDTFNAFSADSNSDKVKTAVS